MNVVPAAAYDRARPHNPISALGSELALGRRRAPQAVGSHETPPEAVRYVALICNSGFEWLGNHPLVGSDVAIAALQKVVTLWQLSVLIVVIRLPRCQPEAVVRSFDDRWPVERLTLGGSVGGWAH